MEHTQSQLTYHGLFHLATTLEPGSLVALFRSSHLAVLYKSGGEDSALYTLVTDQVFLNEPSIVWERLEDVDGGWSTFVDSEFVRASPAGGDFAGQTAEEALQATEYGDVDSSEYVYCTRVIEALSLTNYSLRSQALAMQLQAEEDRFARQQEEAYRREQQRKQQDQQQKQAAAKRQDEKSKKKSKDCIIM